MAEHQQPAVQKPERAWKHIFSFAIMILLTVAAFYFVTTGVLPSGLLIPALVFLAVVQVFLQLFTFMHLGQKGTGFYTFFIFSGLFVAVVSAVGVFYLI